MLSTRHSTRRDKDDPETTVDFRRLVPRFVRWPKPRWTPILVVASVGGGVGYGSSWILGGCTTCATGDNPIVLGMVIALTAGLAAYWGESSN